MEPDEDEIRNLVDGDLGAPATEETYAWLSLLQFRIARHKEQAMNGEPELKQVLPDLAQAILDCIAVAKGMLSRAYEEETGHPMRLPLPIPTEED